MKVLGDVEVDMSCKRAKAFGLDILQTSTVNKYEALMVLAKIEANIRSLLTNDLTPVLGDTCLDGIKSAHSSILEAIKGLVE